MKECLKLAEELHKELEAKHAPSDLLEISEGLKEAIEDEIEEGEYSEKDKEEDDKDSEEEQYKDGEDKEESSNEEMLKKKDEYLKDREKEGKPGLMIMIGVGKHKK